MSGHVRPHLKPASSLVAAFTPPPSGLLQRKCACGGTHGVDGKCETCRTSRLTGVQPRLLINQAGDRYEDEADRIAERVMRMNVQPVQRQPSRERDEDATPQIAPSAVRVTPLVQRETIAGGEDEDEVALQRRALTSEEEPEEVEEEEEEEVVQAKSADAQVPTVTSSFEAAIQSVRQGGGQPLDTATRAFMEPRFGHDFSQVRVHTDAKAAASARAANALAYTVGRDVVFGFGQYTLASSEGLRLIAHELTHVMQQRTGATALQTVPVRSTEEPLEIDRSAEDLWENVGGVWKQVKSAAGEVWEGITGESTDEEPKVTPLEVLSGVWTITDQAALIRRPPPALSGKGKKAVIPSTSFVEILDAVQKGSEQYIEVQEAGLAMGPPRYWGWTAASNIATLPRLKPKRVAASPTTGGPGVDQAGKPLVPALPSGEPKDVEAAMAKYGDLLSDLPASEKELRFVMGQLIEQGDKLRIEYHSYNYKHPKPIPVTHLLFIVRHPDTDPLTSLGEGGKKYAATIGSWDKVAEAKGGWEAIGVSEADWAEIQEIRDDIVYPFLEIILPRLYAPGPLPAGASEGEQIAHKAHNHLGVRYVLGGKASKKKPGLDCSGLVGRVLKDLGLKWKPGSSGNGVQRLRDSPNFFVVEDSQPGDLVFGQNKSGKWTHVGISLGGGDVIHAPHTGRVVSKESEDQRGWQERRRFTPKTD